LSDSYLDPNTHALVEGAGNYVDPAHTDERVDWRLAVPELAKLHGLETSFRIGGAQLGPGLARDDSHHPNPAPEPDSAFAEIAGQMRETLREERPGREFSVHLDLWEGNPRWPRLPDPARARCKGFGWPALAGAAATWAAIPLKINDYFRKQVWEKDNAAAAWRCRPERLAGQELEQLNTLCSGGWLEVVVYAALKRALTLTGKPFDLCPSIRFARTGQQPGPTRNFELDVVAVLGYQLVAVSCTASSAEKVIKQKGFEALHRARQVGGDGVRVIVVGLQDDVMAKKSEEDLRIDVGVGLGTQVEVWPRRTLARLEQQFADYLDVLDWRRV
jgi:hypothetical protein